jgi:hypothetical protein
MESSAFDRDEPVALVPRLTTDAMVLILSVLLVSGSVVAAGLTLYWLAIAGVQRRLAAVDAPAGFDLAEVSRT